MVQKGVKFFCPKRAVQWGTGREADYPTMSLKMRLMMSKSEVHLLRQLMSIILLLG